MSPHQPCGPRRSLFVTQIVCPLPYSRLLNNYNYREVAIPPSFGFDRELGNTNHRVSRIPLNPGPTVPWWAFVTPLPFFTLAGSFAGEQEPRCGDERHVPADRTGV